MDPSESVKVGDRFEWLGEGNRGSIATVTHVDRLGVRWLLDDGVTGFGDANYLCLHVWRRLPAAAPAPAAVPPTVSVEPRSTDGVTVGSRWRWKDGLRETLTVVGRREGKVDVLWAGCSLPAEDFWTAVDIAVLADPLPSTTEEPSPKPAWRRVVGIDWGQESRSVVVSHPAPKPLPFKRHPDCSADEVHAGPTMCFQCELMFCNDMETHNRVNSYLSKPRPHASAPEPMRSGLGTMGDTYRHALPYAANTRK